MTALDQAAGPDAAIRRVRAATATMALDGHAETGKAGHLRHLAELADMAGDGPLAQAHRVDAALHDARALQADVDRTRILHALGDTAQHAAIPGPR